MGRLTEVWKNPQARKVITVLVIISGLYWAYQLGRAIGIWEGINGARKAYADAVQAIANGEATELFPAPKQIGDEIAPAGPVINDETETAK